MFFPKSFSTLTVAVALSAISLPTFAEQCSIPKSEHHASVFSLPHFSLSSYRHSNFTKMSDTILETCIKHDGHTKVLKMTADDLFNQKPYTAKLMVFHKEDGKWVISQQFESTLNLNSFVRMKDESEQLIVTSINPSSNDKKLMLDALNTGSNFVMTAEKSQNPNEINSTIYFDFKNLVELKKIPVKDPNPHNLFIDVPTTQSFFRYQTLSLPLDKNVVIAENNDFSVILKVSQSQ